MLPFESGTYVRVHVCTNLTSYDMMTQGSNARQVRTADRGPRAVKRVRVRE